MDSQWDEAVAHRGGRLVVLGVAGAGKTRLIEQRFSRLIDRSAAPEPELPVPVLCWFIYRHGENIARLFIRAWRKWSRVTDVLSDTIPGIRVVKAFNQEEREIERFAGRNEDVTAEFNRIHRSWTTFWPLLVLGVHAMTVTVWVFAMPRLLGHGVQLPVGTFVYMLNCGETPRPRLPHHRERHERVHPAHEHVDDVVLAEVHHGRAHQQRIDDLFHRSIS